jgi:hypothetical protein
MPNVLQCTWLTGFLLWRQYWRHFWGSFFRGHISLKNWSYSPLFRESATPFKRTCLLIRLKEVPDTSYVAGMFRMDVRLKITLRLRCACYTCNMPIARYLATRKILEIINRIPVIRYLALRVTLIFANKNHALNT